VSVSYSDKSVGLHLRAFVLYFGLDFRVAKLFGVECYRLTKEGHGMSCFLILSLSRFKTHSSSAVTLVSSV
jgi:hypothetical protein